MITPYAHSTHRRSIHTLSTLLSSSPSLHLQTGSSIEECFRWRWKSTMTPVASTANETEKTTAKKRRMTLVHDGYSSGRINYCKGWAWQQTLLNKRLNHQRRMKEGSVLNGNTEDDDDDADRLLLLEHNHVYTLGRGAKEEHLTFLGGSLDEREEEEDMRWKLSRKARGPNSARLSVDRQLQEFIEELIMKNYSMEDQVDQLSNCSSPVYAPNGSPIYRIERGGEVTYHGPGQLVVYPLLDLRHDPYQKDLHWYLRMVEEVIIQTLKVYGIEGIRDEINTGVWVNENKIAAVGVSSSRWITTHGFALNINPDLSFFDTSVIIPCGIEGRGVTSIAQELTKMQNEKSRCNNKNSNIEMNTKGDELNNKVNNACLPSLEDVAQVTIQSFEKVFGVPTQSSSIVLK